MASNILSMADNAIGMAHNALKLNNINDKLQIEEPKTVEGSLQGKVITHPMFFVFLVGSIAGAIVAVVAGIFQMWPLLIVGGLLCVTNVAGIPFASALGMVPALEEGVKQLSEKVTSIAGKIADLHKVNNELRETEQKLQNTTKEYSKTVDEAKKELDKTKAELAAANDADIKTKKEVKSLLHNVTDVFSISTKVFSQENKNLDKTNAETQKHIRTLSTEHTKLTQQASSIDLSVKNFDKRTDDLEELAKFCGEEISSLKSIHSDFINSTQTLVNTLGGIQNLSNKLGPTVKLAELSTQKVQESEKNLTGAVSKLENTILANLEGYDEYLSNEDFYKKCLANKDKIEKFFKK